MSFNTPLAKVRGLGSAKSGTHHWIMQRLTAIALIPLSVWLIFSLITIENMNYQSAIIWMKSPTGAIPMLFFIIALFHHLQLGLQIVIEDYITCKVFKISSLIVLKLVSFSTGIVAIVTVLKIYLGA